MKHSNFKKVVEEYWCQPSRHGMEAFYYLKEKLKSLKSILKDWSKGAFGEIDQKIDSTMKEMDIINGEFSQGMVDKAIERNKLTKEFWNLVRLKRSFIL